MKINSLTLNATKNEVTLNGQKLAQEYAETILLPLMIHQAGQNDVRKFRVVAAFDEAGLSLEAIPEVAHAYRRHLMELERERERAAQTMREAHERMRQPTAREIAEKKAERARRDAEIRAHGERVRAASRSSAGW